MDAPGWRRCVFLSVTEGALATAMGTLLSGVFLTGFALSLRASPLWIGVLAAIPTLAQTAQLAGAYWLERGMPRKRLCVASLAASRLLWIPLLAAMFLWPAGRQGLLIALAALVTVSSVLSSVGGVAWLSWIKDLVPVEKRMGFLGLRNQFDTMLALGLSIAGGVLLDTLQARSPDTNYGFLLIFSLAIACGLIGMPLLAAIPDRAALRLHAPRRGSLFRRPLADGNFRRLLTFYICWNVSVSLAAPFFAVYLLNDLGLAYWQVMALYALASLLGLVANRSWMKLGQRFGTRPVVLLASLIEGLFPLWWVLLAPSTAWLLPLIFLSGISAPPVAVGSTTLVLKIAPEQGASPYLALFNAVMGGVMALAAVLGGWFSHEVAGLSWSFGSVEVGGLKLLFVLSCLGRMLSLCLLPRVQEPGAVTLREMVASFVPGRQPAAKPEALVLPVPASQTSSAA